jgi:hypothetical protein
MLWFVVLFIPNADSLDTIGLDRLKTRSGEGGKFSNLFQRPVCWVAGQLHDSLGERITLARLDYFIRRGITATHLKDHPFSN